VNFRDDPVAVASMAFAHSSTPPSRRRGVVSRGSPRRSIPSNPSRARVRSRRL